MGAATLILNILSHSSGLPAAARSILQEAGELAALSSSSRQAAAQQPGVRRPPTLEGVVLAAHKHARAAAGPAGDGRRVRWWSPTRRELSPSHTDDACWPLRSLKARQRGSVGRSRAAASLHDGHVHALPGQLLPQGLHGLRVCQVARVGVHIRGALGLALLLGLQGGGRWRSGGGPTVSGPCGSRSSSSRQALSSQARSTPGLKKASTPERLPRRPPVGCQGKLAGLADRCGGALDPASKMPRRDPPASGRRPSR